MVVDITRKVLRRIRVAVVVAHPEQEVVAKVLSEGVAVAVAVVAAPQHLEEGEAGVEAEAEAQLLKQKQDLFITK